MEAHHLEVGPEVFAGNGGLGRTVLLPGSPGRCRRIAERLDEVVVHQNRRGLDIWTGRYRGVEIAALPTGMGCPSVDVVVTEVIRLGGRRLLRVGTCGTLRREVALGDLVIATGAVRDEATSDAYTPREYPAVADGILVEALGSAAEALGLAEHVHAGLLHTKDAFFGREFGVGPDGARNMAYMERLAAAGVLASEMEAAHLFVLGAIHGAGGTSIAARRTAAVPIRCGAICAVIGGPEVGIVERDQEVRTEDRLIEVALEGAAALWAIEGAG